MPFVPLNWTEFRNTIASPDPNDLTKNAGVQYAFDADAISAEQIASAIAGAGIKFKLKQYTVGGRAAGLSHDNPDADYTSIDYCIMCWRGDVPAVYIYENGTFVFDAGAPPGESSFYTVMINDAGAIEYYVADVLKYTSLVAPTFPLFADASIDVIALGVFDALIDVGVAAKIDHLPLMGVH